jgi:hypothetical protein
MSSIFQIILGHKKLTMLLYSSINIINIEGFRPIKYFFLILYLYIFDLSEAF